MRRLLDLGVAAVAGAVANELVRAASPLREVTTGGRRTVATTLPVESESASDCYSLAQQIGRGREADRPGEIPSRGWKDILIRTFKEFGDDQIPLVAAGCTFYTLLALFPGVTALVALYGLVSDPTEAAQHVRTLTGVLPSSAVSLISEEMNKVAATADGRLSFAFGIGVVTALWSANKAMKALITGLNIAYDEKETRGFLLKTLVPLAFTSMSVVFAVTALGLGAAGPVFIRRLGPGAELAFTAVYWLFLFIGVVVGIALLYRFGPSRSPARWRWITWGSGVAAIAWVLMSGAFSVYVANFGNYDEKYGALGAAIGFMTWVWLSSMVFLLGAELNSEIEHQTALDTTTGAPEPLGARGAVMADTIGEST